MKERRPMPERIIRPTDSALRSIVACGRRGEEIGSGGFGTVRVCGRSKKRFAVKTFDERHRDEAAEEAEMNTLVIGCLGGKTRDITVLVPRSSGAAFDSETVYRFPSGDMSYIVFATCRGRTPIDAWNLQENVGMTPDNAMWICGEIARKVKALHDCGVYHNDVKRENVLACVRDSDGDVYVRLIDFGLATAERSFSSSAYPGGTYTRLTKDTSSLLARTLGVGQAELDGIASLQTKSRHNGKHFIADSRARELYAVVVTCCKLLRNSLPQKHPVLNALATVVSDLRAADLSVIWKTVNRHSKNGNRLVTRSK